MAEIQKSASVAITVSTNPTFPERYFVDFRDTTGGANRQLRTFHQDRAAVINTLAELQVAADGLGIVLVVIDHTGEIISE